MKPTENKYPIERNLYLWSFLLLIYQDILYTCCQKAKGTGVYLTNSGVTLDLTLQISLLSYWQQARNSEQILMLWYEKLVVAVNTLKTFPIKQIQQFPS